LGAMGALDDVTVTQASAVWELRAAAPTMTPGDLFRAGLRIGRDHIASTVNTLVLAYSGAALPLLALFVLSEQSLGSLANSEAVATEIIRTLVGSIGLVAAVPLTTWLAAHAAVEDGPPGRV
ncbi:MAG: YibE/F family protein, partial [Acidimicrobiia bacterium]|nr:YibE/F family protein [Acidimicrobiia bacterium]